VSSAADRSSRMKTEDVEAALVSLRASITKSRSVALLKPIKIEAYEGERQLLDFIKNILICVQKMNESLTGLEQHEGE